jgi:hypothetical protein
MDWLVKIVLSKNCLLGKTIATRSLYIQIIDNLNDATINLEMDLSNTLTGTVLCFFGGFYSIECLRDRHIASRINRIVKSDQSDL